MSSVHQAASGLGPSRAPSGRLDRSDEPTPRTRLVSGPTTAIRSSAPDEDRAPVRCQAGTSPLPRPSVIRERMTSRLLSTWTASPAMRPRRTPSCEASDVPGAAPGTSPVPSHRRQRASESGDGLRRGGDHLDPVPPVSWSIPRSALPVSSTTQSWGVSRRDATASWPAEVSVTAASPEATAVSKSCRTDTDQQPRFVVSLEGVCAPQRPTKRCGGHVDTSRLGSLGSDPGTVSSRRATGYAAGSRPSSLSASSRPSRRERGS